MLISSIALGGTSPDVLFSLRPHALTLGQIYPGTPAGNFQFPQVVLTYLESGWNFGSDDPRCFAEHHRASILQSSARSQ